MNIATDPFYKRLSLHLLSVALVLLLLYLAQGILVPFFIAILLASLLLPVVHFLQRLKFSNLLSITVTVVLAIIVAIVVMYLLSLQVAGFFDDWPVIEERFGEVTHSIKTWIKEHLHITIRKQEQYINDTTKSWRSTAGDFLGQTVISITEIASYFVLLPIYTFLILYYRHLVAQFLIDVFKDSDEEKLRDILNESQSVSQLYIRGLLMEMAIVFALNAIGFFILGIKYAIFLGLVAAMLNIVPYIGMVIANFFCMAITLISSEDVADALWVCVILAIVQVIDNNFLLPMVVGSKVRINALAAIIGVLAGGALCGIAGMFLSIPGLAILKVVFDRVNTLRPYGMLLGDDLSVVQKK
jgi:predicted PurR-regulated permease PerM